MAVAEKHYTTISGVPIEPLYGPEQLRDFDPRRELAAPGEFPYTRGIHETMYRGRLWTMRQFSGFATPEETNCRYHYLLQQVVIAAVGFFGRGESGELPHGPKPPAVHRLVDAARVGKLPGCSQLPPRIEIPQLLRPVKRLDGHPADGGVVLLCYSHVHIYLIELQWTLAPLWSFYIFQKRISALGHSEWFGGADLQVCAGPRSEE